MAIQLTCRNTHSVPKVVVALLLLCFISLYFFCIVGVDGS